MGIAIFPSKKAKHISSNYSYLFGSFIYSLVNLKNSMSTPLSITNGLTASIQKKKNRLFQNVNFMIFFALFIIQLFTISVLPEIVGFNSSNFKEISPSCLQ